MTPLERAVYKARLAPIVDADARLQTLAKTAEGIRVFVRAADDAGRPHATH